MSDVDDAKEFADAVEAYEKPKEQDWGEVSNYPPDTDEFAQTKAGQPVQYALYGAGYTATTATVKTIPPGCYDIHADTKCVYVEPALKPSGLLLELPEMRSEEVIRIVDSFWNSEKDYKEGNEFVVGGATFKAGILLFGPPGSGKTSVVKLVSNKLVARGGTVFYASGNPGRVSTWLGDFARIENNRKSIVIFEDIDSLISTHGEDIYLEMLDSAKSVDNVLFIATTNYPERLDPRIYNRPGRLSHVVKIGMPTARAREAYLKAILKNHKDVEYIVANTHGFSIDHITALVNSCYREKKILQSEIERLRVLFRVPKSDQNGIGIGIKNDSK